MLLFAGLMAPAVSRAAEMPVILVVGDSLSAGYGLPLGSGWVSLLEKRLADRGHPHRVVNASVSGDTTAGGLTRLPSLLERHRPDVLVIELGANDGLRGIAFEEITANLTAMAKAGATVGSRVLIVGTRLPPNYGAAYTDRFQALFKAVAERVGAAWVPRLLEGVAEDWGLMQSDGLHPTQEAQPRILDNVWPGLEPLLRETSPASP